MKLLIIEDDINVAKTIERTLRGSHFDITIASDGNEGLLTARRIKPDIVVLDIIMPRMDGMEVCRRMRADTMLADTPILFLTARVKDEDRIAGFLAGADDYLVKPFNIDELVLRIRAILRRVKRQSAFDNNKKLRDSDDDFVRFPAGNDFFNTTHESTVVVGSYRLNIHSYEINTAFRGVIRLTPVQFDLLYHLMTHAGEIFSPARLLDEVWDYPADVGSPDLVRVHIKNLRERIETNPKKPQFIRTIAGYGYTIDGNPD
jgi:DNA-binding response OmpR family regulator